MGVETNSTVPSPTPSSSIKSRPMPIADSAYVVALTCNLTSGRKVVALRFSRITATIELIKHPTTRSNAMKCRPQHGAIAAGDGEGTPAAQKICFKGSLTGLSATLPLASGSLRAGWAGTASQTRASFIANTHGCRSQQLATSVAPDLRRTVRRDPSRPPFQSAQDSISNNSYRFGGGVNPSLRCRSAGRVTPSPRLARSAINSQIAPRCSAGLKNLYENQCVRHDSERSHGELTACVKILDTRGKKQ